MMAIIYNINNKYILAGLFIILGLCPSAFSQGSIFGEVRNSDNSTPISGIIYFIGYLDDTDEEIRIRGCTGAGYDNGYWFDDFQNYLTATSGNPYDFHFFNFNNGEMAILSGTIPFNSYHQVNVRLTDLPWPNPPENIEAILQEDSSILISWDYQPGNTYRIYRRLWTSNGSFFRLDDASGSLDNPGIDDSLYVDNTVDNVSGYDYLIIPLEDETVGRHSLPVTVQSDPNYFLCGDADGNNLIQIFDISSIIIYLYLEGPPPAQMEAANCDGRPELNLFDITYLIFYLYLGGPAPICE